MHLLGSYKLYIKDEGERGEDEKPARGNKKTISNWFFQDILR